MWVGEDGLWTRRQWMLVGFVDLQELRQETFYTRILKFEQHHPVIELPETVKESFSK